MNSKKKFEFKETLGEPGSEVIGTIISVKRKCWMGNVPGRKFRLSGSKTDGLCGHLYHAIYPYLVMLEFGGGFPDDAANEWPGDYPEFICPDAYNQVRIQLRRADMKEKRHELYKDD